MKWPRALLIVGITALYGCVLPDYHVSDGKAPQPRLAAGEVDGKISFGDASCSSCVMESCSAEHADCGDDCKDLKWPIAPSWSVSDGADPFVRCVVSQCESACNVRWACVKNYRWPDKDSAYSITIRVSDALQAGRYVEGAKVIACQARDPACSVGMGQESSGVTDVNGNVTLALSRDFVGYFLVDKAADGYVPMIASWSQPSYLVDNTFSLSLFRPAWIQAMATQVGVTLEKDVGHVIFKALNCLPLRYIGGNEIQADADGVSVSYTPRSEKSSDAVYVQLGLQLDPAAKATSSDGEGYGGMFNLRAGAVTLSGSHEGLDVGSAGLSMRPNYLGMVFLVPRAR